MGAAAAGGRFGGSTGGGTGGTAGGLTGGAASGAGAAGGSATQTSHRGYISQRQDQIAAIQEDIRSGSGKQVSQAEAQEMLDSVQFYTGQVGYSLIRGAYNNPKAHPADAKALTVLDSYLHNAPKWQGQVFRGIHVSKKQAQKILSQPDVDMLGPSSWSSEEYVAEKFAQSPGGGKGFLFGGESHIIFVLDDNKSGVSITHVGTFDGTESEVLAPSGIRYPIKSIETVKKGGTEYIYVHVTEPG